MQKILKLVRYRFSCPSSPEDWKVARIDIDTKVNSPYKGTIDLVCRKRKADVRSLLGARFKATVSRQLRECHFCGIIQGVKHCGFEGELTRARVTIVPAFAFLAQRMDSRIFQELSAMDIIKEVLDDALKPLGGSYKLSGPTRGKKKREYCVQYRETDLEFVERLLREEGINYYFDYDKDKDCERLVLFDENRQLPDAKNLDGSNKFVVGQRTAHINSKESLESFQVHEQIVTSGVAGVAWHWKDDAVAKSEKQEKCMVPAREVFRPHQRRQDTKQLELRVKDDLESIQQGRVVGEGGSEAVAFFAGARIEVLHNSIAEFGGKYILTEVHHRGTCPELQYGLDRGESGDDAAMPPHYSNSIKCVPADTPIRPPVGEEKRSVTGAQTARVCGPREGETHVDKHGRILLQFAWDRRSPNAKRDSCWVRVAQSWAGTGWGAQFIPRVGMEAVVEFLNGDPDRPMVTGTVYNGTHATPFKLPRKLTQSGFRTRSSQGSEGFHELRFDDMKGSEEIYLKSQKDWNIEILDKKAESVRGEVTEAYDKSQETNITENKTTRIGKDQTLEVCGNQSAHVDGAQSLSVSGKQEARVQGNVKTTHEKKLDHEVGGDYTQAVQGNVSRVYSGSEEHAVQKGLVLSSSAGGVEIDLAKSFDLSAMKITLKCGAASIDISPSQITVNGGASVVAVQGAVVKIN